MEILQAQKDVREIFHGGFVGQLVAAALWGVSAAACTWHSFRLGEILLVLGGFFIFPLTQLALRAAGHKHSLPKGHPMNALGIQIAFGLGLTLPIVIGIAALCPAWFYPAFMILLGAHYLPFVFMYGMWQYAGLCAALVAAGVAIGMYLPQPLSLGAWVAAAILLLFALIIRSSAVHGTSKV